MTKFELYKEIDSLLKEKQENIETIHKLFEEAKELMILNSDIQTLSYRNEEIDKEIEERNAQIKAIDSEDEEE